MAKQSPEERAAWLITELREASREAAGALKDLQRAQAAARAQVDEYLHDAVSAALQSSFDSMLQEVNRVGVELAEVMREREIQFTAVVENMISRDRIVKAAAEAICASLIEQLQAAGLRTDATAAQLAVSLRLL